MDGRVRCPEMSRPRLREKMEATDDHPYDDWTRRQPARSAETGRWSRIARRRGLRGRRRLQLWRRDRPDQHPRRQGATAIRRGQLPADGQRGHQGTVLEAAHHGVPGQASQHQGVLRRAAVEPDRGGGPARHPERHRSRRDAIARDHPALAGRRRRLGRPVRRRDPGLRRLEIELPRHVVRRGRAHLRRQDLPRAASQRSAAPRVAALQQEADGSGRLRPGPPNR